MRFVVQRVTHASVTVDSQVIGKIGNGFMVLIGVSDEDTKETADKMVKKHPESGFACVRRGKSVF